MLRLGESSWPWGLRCALWLLPGLLRFVADYLETLLRQQGTTRLDEAGEEWVRRRITELEQETEQTERLLEVNDREILRLESLLDHRVSA